MVHGRVGEGEEYDGICRTADGMNKGMDDGEKQGCKGLARMIKKHRRESEAIELERIRKTRFERKGKWEPEMMERIGQEKEEQAWRKGARWGSGVLIQRMDVNSSQGIFVLT